MSRSGKSIVLAPQESPSEDDLNFVRKLISDRLAEGSDIKACAFMRSYIEGGYQKRKADRIARFQDANAKYGAYFRSSGAVLDPTAFHVDVFGPISESRKELRYSKSLAHILNPIGEHRLGQLPLEAFLLLLENACSHAVISGNFGSAEVQAEEEFKCAGQLRTRARVDITIRAGSPKRLIFIETKVDSAEGRQQLSDYEQIANELCADPILVLLNLNKISRSDSRWIGITWLDIAAVMTAASMALPDGPHAYWLQMWCSAVLHTLYGLPPISASSQSVPIQAARKYPHFFKTVMETYLVLNKRIRSNG